MNSSSQDLFDQYHGKIVPQSYNIGFIALSYVVSFIGSASTLELMNRRTGFRGLFNHALLIGSAITMGGIAIWCMHFIGNRAIDIADGQPDLQVAYSSGFTAVSFFIPILVLLAAFMAVGSGSQVSWLRVCISGFLCGTAVCGMHYMGNASIANYVCVYRLPFVVAAAIIAVVASIVALAIFFVYRALWESSWWKRAISGVILAGAVTGMHYCAAVGTEFRLIQYKPESAEPSRTATVIVVICLSAGACFILAGSAILRARSMRRIALRAQQITLAAAVFDKNGRILVNSDGLVPSSVVTDSFLEKHSKEGFSIAHPMFHWMFHASRNWRSISNLIGGMGQHLAMLPRSNREKTGKFDIRLIDDHGEMIEDYELIFRELFCMAASSLAERLKDQVTSVGVLWDEILPTGAAGKKNRGQLQKNNSRKNSTDHGSLTDSGFGADMAEKGLGVWEQEYSRGSLMFLVRRVESDRDAERYAAAGYRFAEPHQVSSIIRSTMQIKSPGFEQKLRDMATYATRQQTTLPGVHLGIFAIRARPNTLGFEVLVRRGARNMLPSLALPLDTLKDWQIGFLKQFENKTVTELLRCLESGDYTPQTANQTKYAGQLVDTIKALREWSQEPLFEDATLTSTVVQVPSMIDESSGQSTMIAMRMVIPIHAVITSPRCEFVPLSFFRMYQVPARFRHEFSRGVHQEFGPIIKKSEGKIQEAQAIASGQRSSQWWPSNRRNQSVSSNLVPPPGFDRHRRGSSNDSVRSGSTVDLCPTNTVARTRSIDSSASAYPSPLDSLPTPSYGAGGILVFQEIQIDVEDGKKGGTQLESTPTQDSVVSEVIATKMGMGAGIEMQPVNQLATNVQVGQRESSLKRARRGDVSQVSTFVDILMAECVDGR